MPRILKKLIFVLGALILALPAYAQTKSTDLLDQLLQINVHKLPALEAAELTKAKTIAISSLGLDLSQTTSQDTDTRYTVDGIVHCQVDEVATFKAAKKNALEECHNSGSTTCIAVASEFWGHDSLCGVKSVSVTAIGFK